MRGSREGSLENVLSGVTQEDASSGSDFPQKPPVAVCWTPGCQGCVGCEVDGIPFASATWIDRKWLRNERGEVYEPPPRSRRSFHTHRCYRGRVWKRVGEALLAHRPTGDR